MNGVIILDEKQYLLSDISNLVFSQSEKQFTLRIETSTNKFHDGLPDEEDILTTLIGQEMDDQHTSSSDELVEHGISSTVGDGVASVRPQVVTAMQTLPPAAHPAFNRTQPTEIQAVKPRVRISVEPTPNSGHRSAFGAQSPIIPQQQTRPSVTNAPSGAGILMSDAISPLVGQKFPIQVEYVHILRSIRRDLLEEGGIVYEADLNKMKNLKKNQVLKSEPFNSLDEKTVRGALMSMVLSEQVVTRGDDRENKLFIEMKPMLVVDAITNESAGLGVFYFEEMVSVYENPKTYYKKVDNGKD